MHERLGETFCPTFIGQVFPSLKTAKLFSGQISSKDLYGLTYFFGNRQANNCVASLVT
jgi:hypothetical protein